MLRAVAAAVVDSRNMFHQAGDAIGVRACPTVPGVRKSLARFGFDVAAVHVGLALARKRDQKALERQHLANQSYRQSVIADGGDVLLGELHCKPRRAVEEKMVDSACCVRITRYVDEIVHGRTSIEAIVVLSKDIDLTPAIDYAVEMQVPIFVAALDVVQHRPHPFILLGPHSYAELTNAPGMITGHDLRALLVRALHEGKALTWSVEGTPARPLLRHQSGLVAVPAPGSLPPSLGSEVSLHPVDVTWNERILGSFPLLVCATRPRASKAWVTAMVLQRTAPMTVEISRSDGTISREHFPLGGVVPGETVMVHAATGRVLGPLQIPATRSFDPDTPQILSVVAALPRGGTLVVDSSGTRGLLTTDQMLVKGQHVPAVQVGLKPRGPVWAAIGRPLS